LRPVRRTLARERLLLLRERRRHAWNAVVAFGISQGQVKAYLTDELQELRNKAEESAYITVLKHRKVGCRTVVSARDVLELVEAISALDDEIENARQERRS
jgi:hypothetical protein